MIENLKPTNNQAASETKAMELREALSVANIVVGAAFLIAMSATNARSLSYVFGVVLLLLGVGGTADYLRRIGDTRSALRACAELGLQLVAFLAVFATVFILIEEYITYPVLLGLALVVLLAALFVHKQNT